MSLHILIGPMFAGKSSRILDIVARNAAIDTPVIVIKHIADARYSLENEVVTHDNRRCACLRLSDLDDIPPNVISQHAVFIVEEAQFFRNLVPFCEHLVDTLGKRVYLIGLDGDSSRRPFGEILQCIPLADTVEKLHAFCRRCRDGTPALFTWRNSSIREQTLVGGTDKYEALCRGCYVSEFNR